MCLKLYRTCLLNVAVVPLLRRGCDLLVKRVEHVAPRFSVGFTSERNPRRRTAADHHTSVRKATSCSDRIHGPATVGHSIPRLKPGATRCRCVHSEGHDLCQELIHRNSRNSCRETRATHHESFLRRGRTKLNQNIAGGWHECSARMLASVNFGCDSGLQCPKLSGNDVCSCIRKLRIHR